MKATPPRWASWLLSVRLPTVDRDEVIGDLNEEFVEVARARGHLRARAWYWSRALRLAWALGGRSPVIDPLDTPSRSRLSFDELRYAIRRLKKQPAATMASIVTLAAAIGVAVAAGSLLSAVLIRPLPLVRTDGLVTIGDRSTEADASTPFRYTGHTYQTYRAVSESDTFARVTAIGYWPTIVTVNGAVTLRQLGFVPANFFDTLGVHPRAGRGLLPEDDRVGARPVAVLSDLFWRRVMQAAPDAIGREFIVGGNRVLIVGIAPAGFSAITIGNGPDAYVPIHTVADLTGNRNDWLAEKPVDRYPTWLQLVAQLKPGTDAVQAAARLDALQPPNDMKDARYVATEPASAVLSGTSHLAMTEFAKLLAITVGLLLLIGCLTAGMLVLLRTEARRDEFALCLALGATRRRLAGGVLLEGALLSTAGALLAVPLSGWFIAGVRTFSLPGHINIDLLDLPIDWRTMAAAMGAAATATLLIALIAGVFGVSANVADALRARAGATRRIGRQRTRAALVIVQMAVALVLLAGAGLFARSLSAALSLNPKYDMSRIATGQLYLADADYTPARARTFLSDLRERLMHDPAIRSVSVGGSPGLAMHPAFDAVIDGERRRPPSGAPMTLIDDHYFSTMGLPILMGRDFTVEDRETSPQVAIVSASLGRFVGKGGNPLGHRIQVGNGPGVPPTECEVVGVVPDVITGVQVLEPLVMYRPLAQVTDAFPNTVILRAAGDPAPAIHEAVAAQQSMDPAIAMPRFATIEANLMQGMQPQQFGVTVLGALGIVAAMLTLFGMYVLAESMAAARRRELGVRAALGATQSQLGALVLSQTTRLVAMGIGAGLLLTWLGADLIRTFLYRIEPFDLPTIGTVIVLMFGLAMAVTLRPALRAARVDLARVLREE
jgi:predicted permease